MIEQPEQDLRGEGRGHRLVAQHGEKRLLVGREEHVPHPLDAPRAVVHAADVDGRDARTAVRAHGLDEALHGRDVAREGTIVVTRQGTVFR